MPGLYIEQASHDLSAEWEAKPVADPQGPEREQRPATTPLMVQPRLEVGRVDDPLERDADRVADLVMRALRSPGPSRSHDLDEQGDEADRRIQRSDVPGVVRGPVGGDIEGRIRRATRMDVGGPDGGVLDPDTVDRIQRSAGGGRPLDPARRETLEGAFGADFSSVRVHEDSGLAPELGATAFTHGSDIHFARGAYAPERSDGLHLLSHELAHTVQQGAAPLRSGGTSARNDAAQSSAPTARRSTQILQRHFIPMPGALKAPQILKPKQRWSVFGGKDSVLRYDELKKIKATIAAAIPPDSKPSPQERVDRVRIETVPARFMPAAYQEVPAKTESSGVIFFNWECPDYFRVDGTPDPDKVRSTVIHEFFHAVSSGSTGLQPSADLLDPAGGIAKSQLQPDEAVTEILAVRAYEAVFGADKPYLTGYFVTASKGVASSVDSATAEIAKQERLPVAWTGDMVKVLQSVLSISEDDLIKMYFSDPGAFKTLTSPPGVKQAIIEKWNHVIGVSTVENRDILSSDHKQRFLIDAITPAVAKRLAEAATPDDQIRVMQFAAAERGAPVDTSPAAVGDLTFSAAYVKRVMGEKDFKNAVLQQAALVRQTAATSGPTLAIKYPGEQQLVTSSDYTIRTDVSDDVNNVRVNVSDEPSWRQARHETEAWFTDVRVADLPEGPVEIVAEAWTEQGRRAEERRTFQNQRAEGPTGASPIDPKIVQDHLALLGVTRPVRIIAVPKSKKVGAKTVAYKLGDAISTYPRAYAYGLSGAELSKSLGDLVGAPPAKNNESAFAYVGEFFAGAGYESAHDLVVVNADRNSSRAMLHELGHFKQDLTGATEANTHVYVLEYHNVLLHENLDDEELRTSYGTVPLNPSRKTWNDLRADVAQWPATLSLLDDIEAALKTAKYKAIADVIKANLVAEFFNDSKGDRAARVGATGAARTPKYPGAL
jgi:Domain of unknown function (DUF4157)